MIEPRNPFPGMNPYLEGSGNLNAMLAAYTCDALPEQLPNDLIARAEERVFIETYDTRRWVRPDVHVFEQKPSLTWPEPASGGVATAEPIIVHFDDEEVTEVYLKIIDARAGGRVVTMIEFVSPSNKREGPGRDLYLKKQDEARNAGVNFVEIDLNRAGQPVSLAAVRLPPYRAALYHASIWRAASPIQAEYYSMPLRSHLPIIPIPLRPGDADATIELQVLFNRVYTRGRYDVTDYNRDPEPPLKGDDAVWADELLREKKLRA